MWKKFKKINQKRKLKATFSTIAVVLFIVIIAIAIKLLINPLHLLMWILGIILIIFFSVRTEAFFTLKFRVKTEKELESLFLNKAERKFKNFLEKGGNELCLKKEDLELIQRSFKKDRAFYMRLISEEEIDLSEEYRSYCRLIEINNLCLCSWKFCNNDIILKMSNIIKNKNEEKKEEIFYLKIVV